MESEILQLEERLRLAMLQGDVPALDGLIDDALVFIGPDGAIYTKQDDLELYRLGMQKISLLEFREVAIRMHGATAVSVVMAYISGNFKGEPYAGLYRYIRTWARDDGWRIVAGAAWAQEGQQSGPARFIAMILDK